ncbi:hypothetical protein [Microbacterium sp. EST19A]|uniref:hypothetical protein n=1 Tax=Microbacterium sp. EST19A TaxID=2862681 RepID=UPI001CBEEBD3|nr:hypothetical protein [Microbacterium sp. EST19A]
MRLSDITPLAHLEYQRLAPLTSLGGVQAWAHRNAARTRKREQHVVILLAAGAASTVLDGSTFYRLELPADTSTPATLSGRLITAMANNDHPTVEALVQVWTNEPQHVREAVLVELATTIKRPPHPQ